MFYVIFVLCVLAYIGNKRDVLFAFCLIETSEDDDKGNVRSGGDVWVLSIKNAKPTDSGIYVCEVNSNPIVRSFHKLSGKNSRLLPFSRTLFRSSLLPLHYPPILFIPYLSKMPKIVSRLLCARFSSAISYYYYSYQYCYYHCCYLNAKTGEK